MKLQPNSIEHLQKLLSQASEVTDANLSTIDKLIEHIPADMTATVQAGMMLATFQEQLAKGGQ